MPRAGRSDINIDMTATSLSAARDQIAGLQDELLAAQEDLSATEDAKETLETERDELRQELETLRNRIDAIADICGILGNEDKTFTRSDVRRLEWTAEH